MGKILKNKKVLLIGDTIIDRNVYLEAVGLSLESPTMKANYIDDSISFGGAANVAKHLSYMCEQVCFVTSLVSNNYVDLFKNRYNVELVNTPLQKDNIKSRYWITKGDSKYKYLQINDTNTGSANVLSLQAKLYDAVAISDYRCGLVSKNIILEILTGKYGKNTFAASQVSSREDNFLNYAGFKSFVLNKSELDTFCLSHNIEAMTSYKSLSAEKIYVTDGAKGSMVFGEYEKRHVSAKKVDKVMNTIGAGDAYYAAILASNGDLDFANSWAAYYISRDLGENVNFKEFLVEYEQSVS